MLDSPKTDLVCPSCRLFLANPVTLNCCTNSICSNCFKLLLYTDDKTGSKILFNCPICKKEGEESTNAYQNQFFAKYMEVASKENTVLDQYSCERCDAKLKICETYVCQDCGGRLFCNNCLDSIHNVGKFKSHDKTLFLNSGVSNTHISDEINCPVHKNEKGEYICTKDYIIMCNICLNNHKQVCRNSNLFIIRDSLREMLNILTLRNEKLSHQKVVLQKYLFNLKTFEQELDKSYEKGNLLIADTFKQIKDIVEFKEREIKMKFEQTYSKKKSNLKQDIKIIEQSLNSFQSVFNQINFAIKNYDTHFLEGARYLFSRIDRVLVEANLKKDAPSPLTGPELQNIEDCKNMIYKLSMNEPILPSSLTKQPIAATPKTNNTQSSRASTPNRVSATTTPYVYDRSKNSKINSSSSRREELEMHSNTLASFREDTVKDEIKTVSTKINFNELSEREVSPNFARSNTFRTMDMGLYDSVTGEDTKENSFVSLITQTSIKPDKSPGPKERASASFVLSGRSSAHANFNFEKNITTRNDYKSKSPTRVSTSRHSSVNDVKDSSYIANYDVGHLSELQKNPLIKRQLVKTGVTSNSVLVGWTHSFQHTDLIYYLEYGTGSRIQGVEQFRLAYKGSAHTCIISDLNPKTSYRVRVCPVLLKNSEENIDVNGSPKKEIYGEWSDVITISTREVQSLDLLSLGSHGKMTLKNGEYTIQFDRSGIITALHEYTYGKVYWDVKLLQQTAHQSTDDSSSNIKVGVTTKAGKSQIVYGSQINYGLNKNSIKIRVALDMDSRTMTIISSNQSNPEIISNLPDGPLYPAFQNKTNKSSLSCVKLAVQFDVPPF